MKTSRQKRQEALSRRENNLKEYQSKNDSSLENKIKIIINEIDNLKKKISSFSTQ